MNIFLHHYLPSVYFSGHPKEAIISMPQILERQGSSYTVIFSYFYTPQPFKAEWGVTLTDRDLLLSVV